MTVLRGSVVLSVGTAIYQGSRLSLGLVAAAVLGPAVFGLWVLLLLVVQFSGFLGFGIANGAGRELPYLRGAAREQDAARTEEAATAATLALAGLAAAVGVVAGALILPMTMPDRVMAIALLSLVMFLQQLVLWQQVSLRSSFRFGATALQLATTGIVLLIVGLLVLPMGLTGLLVALLAASVAGLSAARLASPVRGVRLRWDLDAIRGLVAIGFPILLAGLLFALLTTVDRWLVLGFLGVDAVGVYGIAGMFVSGLLLVPAVLGQQFYPALSFSHGSGRGLPDLMGDAARQGRMTGWIVVALGVPGAIVAIVAIPAFLPAYSEAVAPIAVATVGVVAYAFSSGYGNLLNTIGAHWTYLRLQSAALILDLVAASLALAAGLRLLGVAVAFAVSMLVYAVLLAGAADRATRSAIPTR
ncbi:MAG: oligosaccharide flippase family protein [Chloroflexi bacterium]|nr:oligosaccharide flippase family protein [Chloroflexota bacterium]